MYSTMNAKVELLGTDYAKTANTVGYQTAGGTSAATPVVAAGYALLRQAFPSASAQLVLDSMKQSGRLIDDVVRKQIPVVDLVSAFNMLSGNTVVPSPPQSASPSVSPVVTPKITFTFTAGTLVIVVKGYEGSKFTAKLGNSWLTVQVLENSPGLNYTKIVRKTGSKTAPKYEAYINGKRVSASVTIR
jgi:hypothetical protein